jgi:hypothetical protein
MKTRTLKTSVGIVAVAALVGMNLFHAWNNYGIKDSSKLLCINASPAEDSTEVKCDTKPGVSTIYHNYTGREIEHIKNCVIGTKYQYYRISKEGFRKLVYTEITYIANYPPTTSGDASNLSSCERIQSEVRQDFKSIEIVCDKIEDGKCCYPQSPLLDCSKLIHIKTN